MATQTSKDWEQYVIPETRQLTLCFFYGAASEHAQYLFLGGNCRGTLRCYFLFSSCPWLTFRKWIEFIEGLCETRGLNPKLAKKALVACGPPKVINHTVSYIYVIVTIAEWLAF